MMTTRRMEIKAEWHGKKKETQKFQLLLHCGECAKIDQAPHFELRRDADRKSSQASF